MTYMEVIGKRLGMRPRRRDGGGNLNIPYCTHVMTCHNEPLYVDNWYRVTKMLKLCFTCDSKKGET